MESLYDRLGGIEAITAVVDACVARCAGDERINPKFERSDIPRLRKMLVDEICEATGGPCTYTGRDMKETHDGIGVTAGEFDALVEDLVATLDEFSVPQANRTSCSGSWRQCARTSSRSSLRKPGLRCLRPTRLHRRCAESTPDLGTPDPVQ